MRSVFCFLLCGGFTETHKKLTCVLKGSLFLHTRQKFLSKYDFIWHISRERHLEEKAFSCARRVDSSVSQMLFRFKAFSISFRNRGVEWSPGILLDLF